MKIELPTTIQVHLGDEDLARALLERAREMAGNPDDAGCDWTTDDNGNTYINGNPEWQVSGDATVAAMIDLYHALTGSNPREFKVHSA